MNWHRPYAASVEIGRLIRHFEYTHRDDKNEHRIDLFSCSLWVHFGLTNRFCHRHTLNDASGGQSVKIDPSVEIDIASSAMMPPLFVGGFSIDP